MTKEEKVTNGRQINLNIEAILEATRQQGDEGLIKLWETAAAIYGLSTFHRWAQEVAHNESGLRQHLTSFAQNTMHTRESIEFIRQGGQKPPKEANRVWIQPIIGDPDKLEAAMKDALAQIGEIDVEKEVEFQRVEIPLRRRIISLDPRTPPVLTNCTVVAIPV